ncbi:hypothetical protein SLS57_009371 [Botryosphaeria dothidea]
MRLASILAPALLALAASSPAEAARNPRNSALLSNVKTLTLRKGQMTAARRVSPIPQLTCIGGDAKGLYEVDVMRCKNAGSDYDDENIQWTCQASLPEEFKLASADVICEGYDSPDDPYVLKGSCGVEYRLMLTSKGLEKYGNRRANWDDSYGSQDGEKISQGITILFWLIFFGVVLWMIFAACVVGGGDARDRNTWTGPRFDGGGGGGVHVRLTPTNVSRILPTLRATKDGDPDFGPVRWVELLLGISRAIVAPGEQSRKKNVGWQCGRRAFGDVSGLFVTSPEHDQASEYRFWGNKTEMS